MMFSLYKSKVKQHLIN